MGEGESFYQGERMPTADALEKAGIPIPGLQARDGLAAINGSNLITGIGCLILYDAERWIAQAEIAAAMTLEALLANMKPYDGELHELRGFRGAVTCAANLRKVMDGSDLVTGKLKVKVQDAYSMRSTPQVIGALRDLMAYARKQFEIELNGVADNPIFVRRGEPRAHRRQLPGHAGQPAARHGGRRASPWSRVLSERRLNRLLNPALSRRAARVPHQGRGHVLRPHAQPVHRRHADRRAAHPEPRPRASSRSRRPPTRRTSSAWG